MWRKCWAIAKRECAVRMKKPSFWILSFLGPVIVALISIVPYAISASVQEKKQLLINVPGDMRQQFPLTIGTYEIQLMTQPERDAYITFLSGTAQTMGHLSLAKDTTWTFYTKQALHPADSLTLLRTLSGFCPGNKIIQSHVITLEEPQQEKEFSPLEQTVPLMSSILVYFFLFTYSVSLLKGVMEEKSNKVMDIILSSVSPAVWVFGKIAGTGLASFVQFMLWLLISYVPFYFFKQKYGSALDLFSPEHIHATLQQTSDAGLALGWYEWLTMINSIPWATLLVVMILSMVFGFILYAALFAIIGILSGRDADAQPYVLPVTSPLIISFLTSGLVIADPQGQVAQWLSVIPFTAPVVLTLRAGLGVGFGELWPALLSIALSGLAVVIASGKLYKRVLNKG